MSGNDPKISRRKFVRNTALLSGGVALLPAFLTSCDDDDDVPAVNYTGNFGFREGVASFDPSATSVLLWTRYTNADNESGDASLRWEVAASSAFSSLVASGTVAAAAANDFTVAVDVPGLTANTKYYYRFRAERTKAESVVGETKTLPTGAQASSVKLAVVSCANFQAGLFNVYGAVAASDADAVVHLGDYIYEYGADGYGTNPTTAALNRVHLPATEIVSLGDYRTRYRQYRSDKQLQRAHQLKPFICVWDDHEYANNAYVTGAENHQPATEGTFEARKLAANQAWFEYLPARTPDKTKIYRRFEFGNLVNLLMLDTRIAGRDRQLNLTDYFGPTGVFNAAAFAQAWLNPTRTLLGTDQRTWLTGALSSSSARWQVLGSQVLMGKMYIPAELLPVVAQLASNPTSELLLRQYTILAAQLSAIKQRVKDNDPTLTPAERARVSTVLPYNLDSWDGYPAERELVYAAGAGKKLISLAGDTHNAWHNALTSATGQRVGAEFACPSVSSPGFEALLGVNATATDIAQFEQSNKLLIDDLRYLDASKRGFVLAEFTAANATAEYRYIAGLATENAATTIGETVVEV